MHSISLRLFVTSLCVVGVVTMVRAEQSGAAAQSSDMGKYLYDRQCVMCHGSSGKGDGFYVAQLAPSTKVPDLTELSKKNNGVFPFMRVYETIDGRQTVPAHGTREMPIWGTDLSVSSLTGHPYYNDEAFVRARILALTEYIYRLQAK